MEEGSKEKKMSDVEEAKTVKTACERARRPRINVGSAQDSH